jgi:hypothetical protein
VTPVSRICAPTGRNPVSKVLRHRPSNIVVSWIRCTATG